MGVKGSWRRPSFISREQEDLNYLLAMKKINFETYKRKRKKLINRGLWGVTRKLRNR